ncbi:FAD-binding protein [Nannocystis pusilla]|uniref:FAD-binding protein n=1 Tax=Nannocystis pusilla TaxID=889268 RepID=UPI003B7A97EB
MPTLRQPQPRGAGEARAQPRDAPNFPSSIPVRWEPYRNWARTVTVDGVWVCEPRDTAEVVSLVNWARVQGFRIRASAGRHNFTPLTVSDGADANRVLLVDTRKHLTGLRMVSTDPAAVQVGAGVPSRLYSRSWRTRDTGWPQPR